MNLDYQELIIKFFAGEISDDELALLKSWLSQDKKNRQVFDQENELWQESDIQTRLGHFNADLAWENISTKLRLKSKDSRSLFLIRTKSVKKWSIAASIVCIMIIGSLALWISGKDFNKQIANATIITTQDGEKSHILLSDSTEITLNSGSKFMYDNQYNLNNRIVKLEGEAFFDVHTNSKKPFVVQLDRMSISAIGTKFNVLSFDNEDRIETTLVDGKVQISINGHDSMQLKTGQQAIFSKHSGEIEIREVLTETYTSWKENKLRFNDAPMEETLRRIARKYNVTFELTNKDLLDLKYTGTFIDEPIEEVMQMLKVVSPITYKINYRTLATDKIYLKPEIVIGLRKTL